MKHGFDGMAGLIKHKYFGRMYDSQQNLSLKFFEVQNYLIIFHQRVRKQQREIPAFKKKQNSNFDTDILWKCLKIIDSVLK